MACVWTASTLHRRTGRYKAGRCLHRVTNGLVFVTEINGRALMTDYSGAIFALVAITSVLTAAVVFVLAQPTDLPVIKKIQGWTAPVPPKLRLNNGHTRSSRSRHQLRHRLLRFEHLQDESSSSALNQWPFWYSIFKIECQNSFPINSDWLELIKKTF